MVSIAATESTPAPIQINIFTSGLKFFRYDDVLVMIISGATMRIVIIIDLLNNLLILIAFRCLIDYTLIQG